MLFTSFPRLRGGVYKGLGAFLRGVVVGIFFFIYTHPPPSKLTLSLLFSMLSKNKTGIKKQIKPTQSRTNSKNKKIVLRPFISHKTPFAGADGASG